MKIKLSLPYPFCLWITLLYPYFLNAQTFTDLPGPMGTTRSILIGTDATLYVGSNSKGVFRSMDAGQTWSGLGGNTIMAGRINALVFDTSGQILAATEQGGIKKWDGSSWNNLNTGLVTACGITIPIRTLAVTPSGKLFAGAHGFSACFPMGDLFQFDGNAWSSISAGIGNTQVNTLAIHPVSGTLFAGTDGGVFHYDGSNWVALSNGLSDLVVHELRFAPNGDLFAGTNAGLEKLANNASVWSGLNNGLNGAPVHSIALGVDPLHIILGTGYDIEQTGSLYGQLFESIDGGSHWTQVAPDLQTTVINEIAFVGNETCLAAGWGIFKSIDNGHSWGTANSGFSAKAFNTQGRLAVSPAPNHALFYGSDDGVYRSLDEGLTWSLSSQGLTRHIVTLLKSDHFGNLFCGAMRYLGENSVGFGDGMLYKSTDNGDHWEPVVISKDWRYMEMSELPNGDLICAHGFGAQPPSATITGSSLALSSDHGSTWVDLDVKSGMAFCCAANANGDLFVAGESQSVYRSTNGGNSFELIVVPGQAGNVGTLEISPTGDILMGSGGQRTLYFSTDNGTSYDSFSSPVLPDYRGVSDVVFGDLGIAYCTTSGQGGSPALFTISPPFTSNSTFTPIAGLGGSLFKMTWDQCGYLYIYRGGGILKSSTPLRQPEVSCISGLQISTGSLPNISIFPNPVVNALKIHLEYPGKLQVDLFNLSGHKILTTKVLEDTEIDFDTIPAGVYGLKIRDEKGGVQYLKILKI
jgi:photosystem II stability/assembly factor-like uncharacterized protein